MTTKEQLKNNLKGQPAKIIAGLILAYADDVPKTVFDHLVINGLDPNQLGNLNNELSAAAEKLMQGIESVLPPSLSPEDQSQKAQLYIALKNATEDLQQKEKAFSSAKDRLSELKKRKIKDTQSNEYGQHVAELQRSEKSVSDKKVEYEKALQIKTNLQTQFDIIPAELSLEERLLELI